MVELILHNLGQLNLPKEQRQEIESEIMTLNAQVVSPHPKSNIIIESLKSIRNILEGMTGSLVASGILYEISKFFNTDWGTVINFII